MSATRETPPAQARPAAQAFEAMAQRFAAGPVVHYTEDFTTHDRRLVNLFMVPGMRALWHLRPTGTELAFLGVGDRSDWLASVRRLVSPQKAQLYLVSCRAEGTVVELCSYERAELLARQRPLLDVSVTRSGGQWHLAYCKGGRRVAEGRFAASRQPMSCTHVINAHLSFDTSASLAPVQKVIARLQLEEPVNAALGSLFWRFGELTVDGQPGEAWLEQLGLVCAGS